MYRKIAVPLMLMAAIAAASTALVRIDFAPGQSVSSLPGVPVMMEFDGWCLSGIGQAELDRLSAAGFSTTVLDDDFDASLYVYVMHRPGFDRARLSAYGRVLTSNKGGVILKTTEPGIGGLNRLPVELARVSHEPMVLSSSSPNLVPSENVDDSLVWLLVNRVNEDSVVSHISSLVAFYTRYSTTESLQRAVEWTKDKFEYYNCDSTALEQYRSNYKPNVIGAKFGRTNRRPIYVICGHIDNTSEYQPNRAPGSDDNASGTAAVIEACRVFADMNFEKTVYFIGFTGEEQGLYGSDSFCRRASRRGDSIQAALNFDMISYGRQSIDTFEVIGKTSNPNCAPLVDAFIANADTFSNLKTKRSMVSYAPYSDHDRFWARGWPAFCGIELDFTPEYHTIGDTIGPLYYSSCGTNNIPMATDAIRAAVATIAKLAGATPATAVEEPVRIGKPGRILGITPSVGSAPMFIEMSRVRSVQARVEVFDATGRQVRTIAAGPNPTWDGTDDSGRRVGTGIYLFRLIDDDVTSTAKAVLTE